jgi:predicted DNA-binding protein
MMNLQIDDETASVLNQLAAEQHLSPAQLVKVVLQEYLEDCRDVRQAEAAYQRYLDSGKVSHNLNDVVKELGLDN